MSRSFRSFLHCMRMTPPSPAILKDAELPEYIWQLPNGFFKCVVCEGEGYYLTSLLGIKTHCQGDRHQKEAAKAKQPSPEDIPKLKVTTSGRYDPVFRAHSLKVPMNGGMTQMIFTLTNVSPNTRYNFIRWDGPYLGGELRFLQPPSAAAEEEKLILEPGTSLDLTMQITPKAETTLSFKVHLRLEDLEKKVDTARYATVVENCPVRIYVMASEAEKPETEMQWEAGSEMANKEAPRTTGRSS